MRILRYVAGIGMAVALWAGSIAAGHGQILPNGDFEEWQSSGKEPPFDWEEPLGWTSSNAVTEFTAAGISRNSDSHSGSLAAEIRTANVFGEFKPGTLVNGNAKLDFNEFVVDVMSAGTPISEKPKRLTGYYQFRSVSPGDSACAIVLLKRFDSGTGSHDTIAYGRTALPPVLEYTAFTVEIADVNPGAADSVVVVLYSTKPENPVTGGILLVDDLRLDVNTSVQERIGSQPLFQLVQNPVHTSIMLRAEAGQSGGGAMTFSLYSSDGRLAMRRNLQARQSTYRLDATSLHNGVYYLLAERGKARQGQAIVILR